MFYMTLLIAIFTFYTFFESLSGIARFSGFRIGFASLGLSLQNQVLSLNRFIGFLIGPMVGFYADTNGSIRGIASIGAIGSACGALTLVLGYRNWNSIALYFAAIARIFASSGYSMVNLFKADWTSLKIELHRSFFKSWSELRFQKDYFFAQLFTTGLAMPAVFAINILALKNSQYSATILQLTTVVSGLGNLLLNFYTYPKLSVVEVRNAEAAENCYRSIYLGKITGLGLLAPLIIGVAYQI